MKKSILVIILFAGIQIGYAQTKLETNTTIQNIESKLNNNGLGMYMVEGATLIQVLTNVKGWEGDSIYHYKYKQPDISEPSGQIETEVYLYNADIHRIANWIYFAMIDSKMQLTDQNINIVISGIRNNSGFQFPVRGIVFEDIYTNQCNCSLNKHDGKCHAVDNRRKGCFGDKIQESYIFFDGIAVKHKTIKLTCCEHFDTQKPIRANKAQLDSLLNMSSKDILKVLDYARIAHTSFQDFEIFSTKILNKKVNHNQWLKISHDEYRNAMKNCRNNLISAWVYNNIK